MIGYGMRLVFFTISMLVILIITQNNDGMIFFFCNRYYSSEIGDNEDWGDDNGHYDHVFGAVPDEVECRSALLTIGWVAYIPLIVF